MLQGFKAELFKALAHPVRIRILELLRDGERSVSELQVALGVEPSSVSQQLSVLRARKLVEARKEGNNVYYRVTDPLVFALLDTGRAIYEAQLSSLQALGASDLGAEVNPAAAS